MAKKFWIYFILCQIILIALVSIYRCVLDYTILHATHMIEYIIVNSYTMVYSSKSATSPYKENHKYNRLNFNRGIIIFIE